MANQDFNEWVNIVADAATAYKQAKADGKIEWTDSLLIAPILMRLPAAIDGSSTAFRDLSAADIKGAAVKILAASGGDDGKLHVYVEEGFNIVGHGVEIVASVKKIMAA